MAGSGNISQIMRGRVIMLITSNLAITIYGCDRFTFCLAGTSVLAPWAPPAPTVTIGLLQLMILATLTTCILIRLTSIRPSTVGATTVTPFVVLLDNHTTIRKGWKWEVAPHEDKWWEGFHANYLKLNNYGVRTQPFYLLFEGRINVGFMTDVGTRGYYWSFTANSSAYAYLLRFYYASLFPSDKDSRLYGHSIRCLAR